MEFKDLKIGDKVDVIARKGNSYRGYKYERQRTEIIAERETGIRKVKRQVQTKYGKHWYGEENFGVSINVPGGEMSWLR